MAETAVSAMLPAVGLIDLSVGHCRLLVVFAVSVGLTKQTVTGRDLEQVS